MNTNSPQKVYIVGVFPIWGVRGEIVCKQNYIVEYPFLR